MSETAIRGPAVGRRPRPAGAADTPLMRQYLRLKQDHADAFLFFRLGDFYEMFFEDAVEGARILGLTLTSRNKNDPDPIPMCGIPWHQRDAYVARLLKLGRKIAICEQLEAPSAAKPLVDRGVTEILTPGSVTADSFLDPARNNYLVAAWPEGERVGLCVADASTGEVRLAEPTWSEASAMMSRLGIAEWLLPETTSLDAEAFARWSATLAGLPGARTVVPAERFLDAPDPRERWAAEDAERTATLTLALKAAGAAFDYLDRMHGGRASQLTRIEVWEEEETLRYDAATARHLELFEPQPGGEAAHTLWHHLNRSVTPLGARRLRGWLERPLARSGSLQTRLSSVAVWIDHGATRAHLRQALRAIPDLERLAARLASARATPRDLGAIRDALVLLPAVHQLLDPIEDSLTTGARAMLDGIPALEARLRMALIDEPPPVSRDGGIFRSGFDATRDGLDDLAHSGKRWIAELEATERARTGITSLKVGFNRVFGYYLEVTRPHLDKVPATWERRQTLTAAERFVTPELKIKEGEVLGAEERLKAREHELFVALREEAAVHVPALQSAAGALGTLDALAALAEAAVQFGWTKPEIEDSDRLHLTDSRHPVVERLLPRGEFVPNDCDLDASRRQILLVTGPNMGGKSTYLRQVALTVVLAQTGSFVPAARAVIGLVDRVFTRVGAGDRLGSGQSTFMVEMIETADIMRSATPRSLVVLDEVGRGTSTYDGLAIAWAVTEFLHDARGPRPRTLFATHFHELTQLAERLPRLVNVHVLVKEWQDQVAFLHRIADGAADRSYGIHVAQLAGLPRPVIERAREVLAELESERTVEHLEAAGGSRHREARGQMTLFTAPDHPLLDELRALDPEATTPLAALERLAEWKRRYGIG